MSRYATATDLIPQAHCVLGTMLRPFSLGHRLLLAKVSSPLLYESVANERDLAIAVFICASNFHESQDALVRGDWEHEFARWLKKLRRNFWSPIRFNHESELAKFNSYLSEGNANVPVWKHDAPQGVEITAPHECVILTKLSQFGFDHASVLEMYLPMANYLYYSACELHQADVATNPSKWRKVFYTIRDHARLHPEEFA